MANQRTEMKPLYMNIAGRMYGIEYDYQIQNINFIDLIYIKDLIDDNIEDIAEWNCECCNIKVKSSKTKYHLNTRKHHNNYDHNIQVFKKLDDYDGDFNKLTILEIMTMKLLVDKQIKKERKLNDMTECLYCDKTIKMSSVRQHLKNETHNHHFWWNHYGYEHI